MEVPKVYRLINILSIDVAAGAVCSSYFFAAFLGEDVHGRAFAALFLTVWIIYTTDHLLDAKRIRVDAKTSRHAFHQQFFSILSIVVALTAIVNLFLIIGLPWGMMRNGLILAVLIMGYLFGAGRFPWLKEFIAAALYTMGILVPVINAQAFFPGGVVLVMQFFSVALMNLLVFSWFDFDNDVEQKSVSFVIRAGKLVTKKILWIIFGVNLLVVVWSGFDFYFVLLGLIGAGHLGIFLYSGFFRSQDGFRMAGDALFLLPALASLKL